MTVRGSSEPHIRNALALSCPGGRQLGSYTSDENGAVQSFVTVSKRSRASTPLKLAREMRGTPRAAPQNRREPHSCAALFGRSRLLLRRCGLLVSASLAAVHVLGAALLHFLLVGFELLLLLICQNRLDLLRALLVHALHFGHLVLT